MNPKDPVFLFYFFFKVFNKLENIGNALDKDMMKHYNI